MSTSHDCAVDKSDPAKGDADESAAVMYLEIWSMRKWRAGSEEVEEKAGARGRSSAAAAGTDHALSSEELPGVHVHHADIGPWHVARGGTALVV